MYAAAKLARFAPMPAVALASARYDAARAKDSPAFRPDGSTRLSSPRSKQSSIDANGDASERDVR